MRIVTSNEILDSYDYIFAGAGCAGLSLLYQLIGSGLAGGKKILMLDADAKEANDRTWCFWEAGAGPFEPIVHRRWALLDFFAPGFGRTLDIAPYAYKLIRGQDFYQYCKAAAAPFAGIHFLQARVDSVFSSPREGTGVRVGGKAVLGSYVFNSIYTRPVPKPGLHWLLQHFKGRLIETQHPVFEPGRATLMDFRVPQAEGTSFVYVLPFSERQALVEYTLFTSELLPRGAYDAALDDYIGRFLAITDYATLSEEFGVIPMTNHRFPQRDGNIVHLGTAGGRTKGSSGYTFHNIQRHSAALAESLRRKGHPFDVAPPSRRFHFYDSVLLEVLQRGSLAGAAIFRDLFQKNDPRRVLRFLDNESSLAEELSIISSLPTLPFAEAALRQLRSF